MSKKKPTYSYKRKLTIALGCLLALVVLGLALTLVKKDDNILNSINKQLAQCEKETDDYLGLSETDAAKKAREKGHTYRVVDRDGEYYAVTMDYQPSRLNFSIISGKVKSATCG